MALTLMPPRPFSRNNAEAAWSIFSLFEAIVKLIVDNYNSVILTYNTVIAQAGKTCIDACLWLHQPVLSAALIAHVELNYESEEDKNRLCGLVPLPNTNFDFIRFIAAALMNQYQWSQDDPLQKWMACNRLDGASTLLKPISKDDTEKWAIVDRIREISPLAAVTLMEFQAALGQWEK